MFKFLKLLVLGFLGGWLLGFCFLLFGFLIGRSGNIGGGKEYFNLIEVLSIFGLAGVYGAPFGGVLFPIGYYTFLKNVPFRLGVRYAMIGTLIGGLLGAIIAPPIAAITGIVGFFFGCANIPKNAV